MKRLSALLLLVLLTLPAAAQDKVPALGEELTPFGAVRASGRTRAVPPWTGGMTKLPDDAVPGQHLPNPFIEDGRWFTVFPADLERYKVRLSAGLQALLQAYPTFEIPVFPSHRSAAAPQRVYDESLENAKRATAGDNGLSVSGARVGVPFPIPANGAQAMWNHILRWRGESSSRASLSVLLDGGSGEMQRTLLREDRLSPYAAGQEGRPTLYRRTVLSPRESAGSTLLLQGTLDPIHTPYAAWYRAGETGKVVRAPDYAYGTTDPVTWGLRTADMLDLFSGPMDRFDFTLVSRREMYVPYNAYRLNNPDLAPEDFMWEHHPNPQFLRYEMHRVWVVDAKAKPGFRHPFPERTYYLDEDSWQIVMAEHYNAKGDLARYSEAHGVAYPQVPVFTAALEVTYDITGNRYMVSGIDNQTRPPIFDRPLKPEDFTPDALVRKKRR